MINKIFYKLKLSILLATSMVFVFGSLNVFATDIDFYQSNDILFYSPEDTVGDCIVKANNTDYSGGPILNSKQLDQLRSNAVFYQNAVAQPELAEFNIPWQILAAIHFKEHNLKRSGPENKDGPFQIINDSSPVGEYTDTQFQEEANKAAIFIKNKIKNENLDLTTPEAVKRLFFKYNGTSSQYKDQAAKLGFDLEDQNNGEGSPYVMNRADARRDPRVEPTKSNNTWGQIKSDGGSLSYPANNDAGAFIVYQSISTTCGDTLVSGGMTKAQAKKFMADYINGGSESLKYLGTTKNNTCLARSSPMANCVSFSVYFINKYTTLKGFQGCDKYGCAGNGWQVADNIKRRNEAVIVDNNPGPYSIFSWPPTTDNEFGHTGVILGVDKEKGTMVVGEAACSQDDQWVIDHGYSEVNIEQYNSRHPGTKYAHIPPEYLKL